MKYNCNNSILHKEIIDLSANELWKIISKPSDLELYHPLHTVYAAIFYFMLLFSPSWKIKAVSIGCLWHLSTDYIDCLL